MFLQNRLLVGVKLGALCEGVMGTSIESFCAKAADEPVSNGVYYTGR